MVTNHPEIIPNTAIAAAAAIFGSVCKLGIDDYISNKQIAATSAENRLSRAAAAEQSERKIQAQAQIQSSNSLAIAEKRQDDLSNQWWPNKDSITTVKNRVVYYKDKAQEKPTTSVSLYKDIDTSQLKKGSLVKDTLNAQSFLTPTASVNVASGLKETSSCFALDLAKDSMGAFHILKVVCKMWILWP